MTDDTYGLDKGTDGNTISKSVAEYSKHVGSGPEKERGSVGKACQPQHFQMHEPVVVHSLVAADTALGCDEVGLKGKRQGEQLPSRAEGSKRFRKPG